LSTRGKTRKTPTPSFCKTKPIASSSPARATAGVQLLGDQNSAGPGVRHYVARRLAPEFSDGPTIPPPFGSMLGVHALRRPEPPRRSSATRQRLYRKSLRSNRYSPDCRMRACGGVLLDEKDRDALGAEGANGTSGLANDTSRGRTQASAVRRATFHLIALGAP
jgi:hypothetical protein